MMMQEGGVKIWRPRQVRVFESRFSPEDSVDVFPGDIKVYIGPKKRDYEPIDSRGVLYSPRTVATSVEHSG